MGSFAHGLLFRNRVVTGELKVMLKNAANVACALLVSLLLASPAAAETFIHSGKFEEQFPVTGSGPWSAGLNLYQGLFGATFVDRVAFAGTQESATHLVDASTAANFGVDWNTIAAWGHVPARDDMNIPGFRGFVGSVESGLGGGPSFGFPGGDRIIHYDVQSIEVYWEWLPHFSGNKAQLWWKVTGTGVRVPEPTSGCAALIGLAMFGAMPRSRGGNRRSAA